MGQALINLLSNAIKFTPAGGSVDITARCNAQGGMRKAELIEKQRNSASNTSHSAFDGSCVVISIADTGPGIPAQDLPRIFDKFFQGHAGVQKKGSGLGLAIVQHIIQAHGGSIRAESGQPMGTTFYIALPMQENVAARSNETPERAEA
jgi:signal transduction histidine kinase